MKDEKIIARKNSVDRTKEFIIKLDSGLCVTKVMHENGLFILPSFIKKIADDNLELTEDDILYRDETGNMYLISQILRQLPESDSTSGIKTDIIYKILCKAAIGIALSSCTKRDKYSIILEIGLVSYKDNPENVKNILSQKMHFYLKIGKNSWKEINTTIERDKIYIKPLPADLSQSSIIFAK